MVKAFAQEQREIREFGKVNAKISDIGITTSVDTMIRKGMAPYGPSKAGHEALVAIMAQELEGTGVRALPHCFHNGNFGTRAALIFGAASETFVTLEDERHLPNVYADDEFMFGGGSYAIPSEPGPGLGLAVDEAEFQRSHAINELTITA